MHKTIAVALVTTCLLLLAPGAGAGGKLKRLGEDPAGDGPPALDIIYLDVGRAGKNLDMRIGVANMLPPTGGYPRLPAIEWVFDVKGTTYVAEAVPDRTPAFYLFELDDSGAVTQLESPTGTYNWADGFIKILVPLKTIGAKKGTVIAGAEETEGGGDVDAHVHYPGSTYYADIMETDAKFVVP